MARTQKRIQAIPSTRENRAVTLGLPSAHVRLAHRRQNAVNSPAGALQAGLAARLAEPKDDARWSARRSLAVITIASLGAWGVILTAAKALFS